MKGNLDKLITSTVRTKRVVHYDTHTFPMGYEVKVLGTDAQHLDGPRLCVAFRGIGCVWVSVEDVEQ